MAVMFLIEDLPLLCIHEQDVFYRPSIKALSHGRDLRLLIPKASGVAKRSSGGSVGEVGEVTRAQQGYTATLCTFDTQKTKK